MARTVFDAFGDAQTHELTINLNAGLCRSAALRDWNSNPDEILDINLTVTPLVRYLDYRFTCFAALEKAVG